MEKNKLKELRQNKGVTQAQVANDTGISLRSLKRYENGFPIGSLEYVHILAEYYEVDDAEIISAFINDN